LNKNWQIIIFGAILFSVTACTTQHEKTDESEELQITASSIPTSEPLPTISPKDTPTEIPTEIPTEVPIDIGTELTDNTQIFQGQYVSFPTTGVKLIRPDNFTESDDFYGFQQISSQSSVMVSMIPAPYSEISKGFTADQMLTNDLVLLSKEDIEIDHMSGVIISATQSAYGVDFAKWIVVFGDNQATRIVMATYPEDYEEELSELLKAAVLSAEPEEIVQPNIVADVGFTLVPSEKLKITDSLGIKALMYTKNGVVQSDAIEDPLFIAAPSFSEVPIEDERQFAVDRIFQTEQTKVSSIISNVAITIDDLDGYEIIANAEDTESGVPLMVYQVMLFDEDSYIIMQGLVGTNLADEYIPEFKSLAQSFRRNQQ
jgi:hypothetical protein